MGVLDGRIFCTLRVSVCRPRAGEATASSAPAATTAEMAGRASTTRSTAVQIRLPPDGRRARPRNGIRPSSTLSPSSDIIAGSTVTDPAIAISTTEMVATAKPANSCMPDRNMPAMATITVSPETRTDRPDVAAAMRSAVCGSRPEARSSRSRRR